MANISSGVLIGTCISHRSFLSGKALCLIHAWHWTCQVGQPGTRRLDRRQYARKTPNLPKWTLQRKTSDEHPHSDVAKNMVQLARNMLTARSESESTITTTVAFVADFIRSEPGVLRRTYRPNLDHSRFTALKKRHPTYHEREELLLWLISRRDWQVPADHLTVATWLLWYMGTDGYVPAAVWALQRNLQYSKRIMAATSFDLMNTPMSKTLHKVLHEYNQSKSHAWVAPQALITDGLVLELHKRYDEAASVYRQAAYQSREPDPNKDMSKREIRMQRIISEVAIEQNFPIPRPWLVLMKNLEAKSQRPALTAWEKFVINHELRCTIAIGVDEGDAEAHYYMARVLQREHEYRLKLSARNGLKSTDWFCYMSKAAASMDPLAAMELGKFYWKTPFPYLDKAPTVAAATTANNAPTVDGAPAANNAPTVDAAPAASWTKRYPIAAKLLRAVGIPGVGPAPINVAQDVRIPRTTLKRLALAEDWFRIPAGMGYAPALRQLIEMYLEEKITRNLCTSDSEAEHDSDGNLLSSLAKIQSQIADLHEALDNEDNPLYQPAKAKSHIADLFEALEARRIWLEVASNPQTGHMRDTPWIAKEFSNATMAYPDPQYIRRWTQFPRIFNLWINDDDECQDMDDYIQEVCNSRSWSIYDKTGRLLYKGNKQPLKAP